LAAGITHDYFPTQPAALEYLRILLEPRVDNAGRNQIQIVARK
jgi:hypothetical protein